MQLQKWQLLVKGLGNAMVVEALDPRRLRVTGLTPTQWPSMPATSAFLVAPLGVPSWSAHTLAALPAEPLLLTYHECRHPSWPRQNSWLLELAGPPPRAPLMCVLRQQPQSYLLIVLLLTAFNRTIQWKVYPGPRLRLYQMVHARRFRLLVTALHPP